MKSYHNTQTLQTSVWLEGILEGEIFPSVVILVVGDHYKDDKSFQCTD